MWAHAAASSVRGLRVLLRLESEAREARAAGGVVVGFDGVVAFVETPRPGLLALQSEALQEGRP